MLECTTSFVYLAGQHSALILLHVCRRCWSRRSKPNHDIATIWGLVEKKLRLPCFPSSYFNPNRALVSHKMDFPR
ncbi:hypothetical protein SLEP1_g46436 [Rubroshorea leprosula]|uniref:Uncharacterized protein n=1 Tax=Rubroshorea leprosula TaxID=152421 RepID=A0AAV5LNT1_9ROSI|nr:hypothetical protein SLEP1_g46436 [Rubroshorea leprosula]